MQLGPVTLAGGGLRLEPLRPQHADGLLEAGRDPAIWRWMPRRLDSRSAIDEFIAEALQREARGSDYVFAVVLEDGRIGGSTRYLEVDEANRICEIGWTWYAPELWGTHVNPAAKYLLLRHAFEEWNAIRVQLKMDSLNARSAAGVRKLGAVCEGTLRNHRIRPDGTIRDSLMFSIIESEWPAVREGLLRRLGDRLAPEAT